MAQRKNGDPEEDERSQELRKLDDVEHGKERPKIRFGHLRHAFAAVRIAVGGDLTVWLVSGATFFNGAWAITSTLIGRLPERAVVLFPFGVYHWTRLLTLVVGFILVYLSFHLYRRSRVAWWMAIIACGVGVVAHLVHLRTSFNALPQAITLALLLANRGLFKVRSESRNIRLGIGLFLGSLLLALVYGSLGFWKLGERDFGISFSLGDAMIRTLRQFLLLGNPDVVANTRQATWFLQSLGILGVVAAGFAVYSLFRPIVFRLVQLAQERSQAAAIVAKNGRSTLDYFKVWEDKSYFFSSDSLSFISYREVGGVAFCLGDPVGPTENKSTTIRAFLDFSTQNGWVAAFLIPDEPATARLLGLSLLKVGEEATVDLDRFVSGAAEGKYFRYVRRKLESDGYIFERLKAPHAEDVLNEAQDVSDRWLTLPRHREYGFLQGRFERAYLRSCTVCALRSADGRMVAFINEVPSYRPVEATFDMMRHLPGLHWGAMDYLFLRMMVELRNEGNRTLNFGVAPFVGIGNRGDATITERAVNTVLERLDRFVHAKGLRQYKLKFDPEWKDSYLAYQGGPLGLARIALNIGRIL
jgi:phosphatidylglycerol lysyltransferase